MAHDVPGLLKGEYEGRADMYEIIDGNAMTNHFTRRTGEGSIAPVNPGKDQSLAS